MTQFFANTLPPLKYRIKRIRPSGGYGKAALLLAILWFCGRIASAQAIMTFDYPVMDNTVSFFGGSYDTALLRKAKVESFRQDKLVFYFDEGGRVTKSVHDRDYDSTTQVYSFKYDDKGDLLETIIENPRYHAPISIRSFRFYEEGRLVKDSNSSGYLCKHYDYYDNGSLRQELWFGFDGPGGQYHHLQKAFWFGVDSLGRMNRIISRNYMGTTDSAGKLTSNRTLFYNEKNQLVREEEAVAQGEAVPKTLFCTNTGSVTYQYDSAQRLIEITRPDGPSQKITYLPNGLIAEIETQGKMCDGKPYQWKWTYAYTYRD